ncbi:hypothetical protein GFB49_14045 [Epibacterium sp. SM1979]|uniref:2-keto-4-pentenoate hydratase n=1 Tax=Tritonibacter litoralis TaxID=2662264 RepID=A0A843YES9_9RHOB|nr:hypothetical protein [Tritonibacter litoralis]MQQ09586.1 hypothetical protein [Tritonibacter litoralis]
MTMTDGMEPKLDRVALALRAARAKGCPAELVQVDLAVDPAQAYRIACAQVEAFGAWKIGGANPWSRAVFNNQEVFVGPLNITEVSVDSTEVSLAGLVAPLAEPEVMLEIADPNGHTPEARFSRMGLGIEIPASVLPETLKPELMGQICDRAGAGHLWIAAVQPFDAHRLSTTFAAQFALNNGEPADASSANVIGGPLGAAHEFLEIAKRHSLPVASGQWVATGGLCPAVAIKPGDQLRLAAWDDDLHLKFT